MSWGGRKKKSPQVSSLSVHFVLLRKLARLGLSFGTVVNLFESCLDSGDPLPLLTALALLNFLCSELTNVCLDD
ncbi:hypothetical protein COLO4_32961 [Corchorus olitorius]|uniref:Uncharacterized protein n=1 Tax=Corchorus olitorius TaxID=93759 RepID=A0A1R3GX42_9ROSI|nr:hypothetical protein COLO4_32961 [Corchorus olitorius]